MIQLNCSRLCGVQCAEFSMWNKIEKSMSPCGELIITASIAAPYFAATVYYITTFLLNSVALHNNHHLSQRAPRLYFLIAWLKVFLFLCWTLTFIGELIGIIVLKSDHPVALTLMLTLDLLLAGTQCLFWLVITKSNTTFTKNLFIRIALFILMNLACLILQLYDNWHLNIIAIGHMIVVCSHVICFVASLLVACRPTTDGPMAESEAFIVEARRPISEWHLSDGDQSANFMSRLTFYWTNKLMGKGYANLLTRVDDLYELPSRLNVDYLVERTKIKLNKLSATTKDQVTLIRLFHSCYAAEFYLLGIMKFFADSLNFVGPLLLSYLITFMESPNEPDYHGYLYALGMFGASFLSSTFGTHFNYKVNAVGLKLRSTLITMTYEKVLKVQQADLSTFSNGRILNFMSTDAERVVNFVRSFHDFWSLPMQIGIALYLLYREVELAFLAGLMFALLLIPLNRWIANKIGALSTDMMYYKDQRIKTIDEALFGIRILKFCSWEELFHAKISNFRNQEMKYLKGRKYLDALCVYLWASAPVIVAILTFSTYAFMGHQLTAAKVFTSLALFNILITPLNAFPWVVNGVVEAFVSLKRLQAFFDLKDFEPDHYFTKQCTSHSNRIEVCMHKCNFSWLNTENVCTLTNLNLEMKKGQLIGVVGSVGAGKSSIFSAILGEIKKSSGSICVSNWESGTAYVGQEAWLQQGTVRSNILFGLPYNREIYDAVISACALSVDFQQMPFGDSTSVGEQGVTLSGGQKTRISLARAVYQNKDVYLLDDPLSAVDAQVARHIFESCICSILKDKLVVLATHHVKYLHKADRILVVKGGRIIDDDVPEVVLAKYTNGNEPSKSNGNVPDKESDKEVAVSEVGGGEPVLISEEEREIGGVKLQVYLVYLVAVGTFVSFCIFAALFFMQVSKNITDWWLSYWVEHTRNSTNNSSFVSKHLQIMSAYQYPYHIFIHDQLENEIISPKLETGFVISDEVRYYLTVYGILAAINTIFTFIRSFSFAFGGIRAARRLHDNLINKILKAPIRFFDITPVGRIINRFAADCYSVDDSLPFQANRLVMYIFAVAGTVVMTVYGLPWFSLCILPMGIIYFYVQRYYRRTTCELKRLNSVTLSPIFSHFSDTLSGLAIIRAFKKTDKFTTSFAKYLTDNQRVQFALLACGSWLSVRLQIMGVFMIATVATIAVIEHQYRNVNAGLVGLAISYALSITSLLSGLLQAFTETEKEMVAVERISDYVNSVPSEKQSGALKAHDRWPSAGKIQFSDIRLRYSKDLPCALDGVSILINPGEKIGIVGRTGSGKSSLFQALFRTVELESGRITIDDIDLSLLDLHEVRSTLSIIPQSPFLFSGSLRENLDVFGKYEESKILWVIEACGLGTLVERLGNLDADVGDKSSGLSMGERQLVCLARALLMGAKVVCIDEATAHVDIETDSRIQKVLRDSFPTATVLTIAHRIDTIMDYDRVLVMENGNVAEFDTPDVLLKEPGSKFSGFARHMFSFDKK